MNNLNSLKPQQNKLSSLAQGFIAQPVDIASAAEPFIVPDPQKLNRMTDIMNASRIPTENILEASPDITPNPTNNLGAYLTTLRNIESNGGNLKAYNKGSGASGPYQFLQSTSNGLADRLGYTRNYRNYTMDQHDAMINMFTKDNENAMIRHGVEINDLNRWVYHNQGAQGGRRMLVDNIGNTKNIRSNLPEGMDPTIANYLAHWGKRFV